MQGPEETTMPEGEKTSCRFYGWQMIQLHTGGALICVPNKGNHCALIETAHAPCMMEVTGHPADWPRCPRNPEINRTYSPRPVENPTFEFLGLIGEPL